MTEETTSPTGASPCGEHPADRSTCGEQSCGERPCGERPPTVSLCMIVRDNESHIADCLESIIDHVCELVVVDTGSVDSTPRIIEEISKKHKKPLLLHYFTKRTHPECFLLDAPETFSNLKKGDAGKETVLPLGPYFGDDMLADYAEARQYGWTSAKGDFIMWIDSDDIVENPEKIPEIARKLVQEELDSAVLLYDYEQDEKGISLCQLYRTRIVRNELAQWNYPVHEALEPVGRAKIFKDVKIIHKSAQIFQKDPNRRRPANRNYKILAHKTHELTEAGEEVPTRFYFYLGNEARLFDTDLALEWFAKYTSTTEWNEERAVAHYTCGQILEGAGKLDEAYGEYAAASVVCPEKPEGFFGLSRIAYYLGDHKNTIRHHESGEIAVIKARDILHYNPLDRDYFPAICGGRAYLEIDPPNPKRALKIALRGLAKRPDDIHLLAIKQRAKKVIAKLYTTRKIVFYAGRGLEPWSPFSLNEGGIGGSETALVHMARELSNLGHNVEVYSDIDKEGYYDGVKYVHYDAIDLLCKDENAVPAVECDIFVSSRKLNVFEANIKAAKKILWLHDTTAGAAIPVVARNLSRADLILCVSKWHARLIRFNYPFYDPDRILATRNGIDPDLFREEPVKEGQRLIYSSSPDRGLSVAMLLFERIRKEVPEAEFHVYYGFHNIKKLAEKTDAQTGKSEALEHMRVLEEKAKNTPGVIYHGRVSQAEVAKAMLAAKVWFYPTWFEETSCITAMEAQAAECTPVTSKLAGLEESVHHGFLYGGDNMSPVYQDRIVKRAIWCLTHEKERSALARRGREEALKIHPWSKVAEEWNDLFARILS
jgi:glycosyltransferase involved in cell wall biosynthesis